MLQFTAFFEYDKIIMAKDSQNLIWIDLEMTGLDPDADYIIEIATVVTDKNLNVLAEGPVLAVHQADSVMQGMDDWNQTHHGQSGLIKRVAESRINEMEAQRQTIDFLEQWVPKNKSPMCGNSICQDRRFLYRGMPQLEDWFHYRNLDVSTLKELAVRWAPDVYKGFTKKGAHKAMDDIMESINELKYYREHLLKV